MEEDNWMHVGNWSINFSWQQEWDEIPKEYLVFFSSPETEMKIIDDAYEQLNGDVSLANEMLKSIGVNIKET